MILGQMSNHLKSKTQTLLPLHIHIHKVHPKNYCNISCWHFSYFSCDS